MLLCTSSALAGLIAFAALILEHVALLWQFQIPIVARASATSGVGVWVGVPFLEAKPQLQRQVSPRGDDETEQGEPPSKSRLAIHTAMLFLQGLVSGLAFLISAVVSEWQVAFKVVPCLAREGGNGNGGHRSSAVGHSSPGMQALRRGPLDRSVGG